MGINLDNCLCNDKQPALICFSCWRKGVRPGDRLGESTGPTVVPVPAVVEVKAIDEKLLRYKAAGVLDCTCDKRSCPDGRLKCPRHGEFYGSKGRRDADQLGEAGNRTED